MKPRKHVRLTVHIPESLFKTIRHEAIERRMTLGQLVEEAFSTRVVFTHRNSEVKP